VSVTRVSTARQRRSSLGAQQEAVRSNLNGGDEQLVGEIIQIESSRHDDRPKLDEALPLCRLRGATHIIAKLDRLARNVSFIADLMESGIELTSVDFSQANWRTVHILAAVAEHKAKASIAARIEEANNRASDLASIIEELDVESVGSFRRIAAGLNGPGDSAGTGPQVGVVLIWRVIG
jgi:DNA invertase Pin-like site-specific DNA recombinase